MQSIQPERVGVSLDSRPSGCRNPYRYNTNTEEGVSNLDFFACVTRDAVNRLEIRNRV